MDFFHEVGVGVDAELGWGAGGLAAPFGIGAKVDYSFPDLLDVEVMVNMVF